VRPSVFLLRTVLSVSTKGCVTGAHGCCGVGDGAFGGGGGHRRSTQWNNFSNPLTAALLSPIFLPHSSPLSNLKELKFYI
jgi:hypothetical protein